MSESKQSKSSPTDGVRHKIKIEDAPRHDHVLESAEDERLNGTPDAATGDAPSRLLDPAPSAVLRRRPAPLALTAARSDAARPILRGRDFSGVPAHTAGHPVVQPKLTVGPAGDRFEQEADRVAEQVMAMSAPVVAPPAPAQPPAAGGGGETGGGPPPAQRQAQEEEDEIRTKRGPAADGFEAGDEFESRLAAERGGGPLPGALRTFMEPRFGADFSGVRVHTGGEAAQLNRAISAQAFTHGQDIFLGEGQEDLESSAGQRLLAHELTHVVQQGAAVRRKNGPVAPARLAGRQARGIQRVPSENEADNQLLITRLGADKANWIISHPTETVKAWLAKKGISLRPFKDMSVEEFKDTFKHPEKPTAETVLPEAPKPTGTEPPAIVTAPPPPPPAPELGKTTVTRSREDLEKQARDNGFQKLQGVLYRDPLPAEGTFEYVANYIYESVEDDSLKRQIFDRMYEIFDTGSGKLATRPRKIADVPREEKIEVLKLMMDDAFKQYTEDDAVSAIGSLSGEAPPPEDIGREMSIKELLEEAQKMRTEKKIDIELEPPLTDKSLPQGVGVGFHGTTGDPTQVTKSAERGGWGGLKKTYTVPKYKTRYALDADWNPLSKFLSQGSFYRRGKNWDNELLSTVSISTKPAAAIKFPFPSGTDETADVCLYAAVVEKAYPTFKIQKQVFPEVAVKEVKPEDLIGYALVSKQYSPDKIQKVIERLHLPLNPAAFNERSNEKFAYAITTFSSITYFREKWGPEADKIIEKAAARIRADVGENQWGIYDNMNITKK